jgi:hypothetical protein
VRNCDRYSHWWLPMITVAEKIQGDRHANAAGAVLPKSI